MSGEQWGEPAAVSGGAHLPGQFTTLEGFFMLVSVLQVISRGHLCAGKGCLSAVLKAFSRASDSFSSSYSNRPHLLLSGGRAGLPNFFCFLCNARTFKT